MATKILATDGQSGNVKPGKMPGARSSSKFLILLVGLVVVAVVVGAGLFMRSEADKADQADKADKAAHIASNVAVGDLAIGGMTVEQAQAAIQDHFSSVANTPIKLTLGDKSWTFKASDLGVGIDAASTAKQAHDSNSGDVVAASTDTTAVTLVLTHDEAAVNKVIQGITNDVAVAPVDAKLQISSDAVAISPAKDGQKLDVATTVKSVDSAIAAYPFGSASATSIVVPAAVHDADLAPAAAQANKLSSEPLVMSFAESGADAQTWSLTPKQLRGMLSVSTDAAGKTTVGDKLDSKQLDDFVSTIVPTLKQDPQDASLALPDYAKSVTLTPDVAGREVNVTETLAKLETAAVAAGADRTVVPVIDTVTATVTAAALQPIKDKMDALLANGISVTDGTHTYQISADKVVLKLYLQKTDDATAPFAPLVYDADMTDMANSVAKNLNTDAVDATYRLVDGKVTLAEQPQEGFDVDVEATAANIKDAMLNGKIQVALVGTSTQPTFADTSLTAISTPDKLGQDSTYYGGSSPERNWNVTYGASKLDGWYIAPGAVFSLNKALGPLTLDAGFKMGWGILVQGGSATTIPSEAGGICQVATTLFHPAFWAGLTFTERHHHSYWIASYGVAPMGMQGLDATIDPPYSDLKIKNTTGNWIVIRANGDTKNVTVSIWGTDPHWTVKVDGPVITNVVKTDTTPRTENNDQLATGRTVVAEHAQDGFDVDIHRQVFDASGAKINDWHASGTYLPSHNVTVVGTGPATN